MTWGPALQHWAGLAVRCWRAGTSRIRRLGDDNVNMERAWPDIGEAMAELPKWHEQLRARVRSSRMVDMGVVDRDALHDIVEDHIARRADHTKILGTWLTLEVWLGQYEDAAGP